jgi:transposase-like protein
MDKRARFPIEFKHEVCKYYDNHTGDQTIAKYGITRKSLHRWRNALGYRNKFFNYNLYTEELQPTVQKRDHKNFMITKKENGQLQAQVVELQQRLEKVEADARLLKSVKALFMEV